MRDNRWLGVGLAVGVLCLVTGAARQERPARLTQIATIDSLLAGNFEGEQTVRDLKTLGDFGIGTFNGLDGEMVAADGRFYQAAPDTSLHPAADDLMIPYASVAFFNSGHSVPLRDVSDFQALGEFLDRQLKTENVFYAVKIRGRFPKIRIRSVPRQSPPYRPMSEFISKEQTIVDYENTEGTVVGFRSPVFMKGLGVPGYHFHFIRSDEKVGGHLLDLAVGQATAEIAELRDFRMILPRTESFDSVRFGQDRSAELTAVEK